MTDAADVTRVAKAIEDAGTNWLLEQRKAGKHLGWADVPETIFAEAAIKAYEAGGKINTASNQQANVIEAALDQVDKFNTAPNVDRAAFEIARVYYLRLQGRKFTEAEWKIFHQDAKETWLLAAAAGLKGAKR